MKIFLCKLGGCDCHPEGLAFALAFNRGHAVKILNKRLEVTQYGPLLKDEHHRVEELDPTDPAHKKGFADLSFD